MPTPRKPGQEQPAPEQPAQQPAPDDAPKVTTEDAEDTLANTSSDAEHSTYREVEPDTEERPKPGRQVEQERGTPSGSEGESS